MLGQVPPLRDARATISRARLRGRATRAFRSTPTRTRPGSSWIEGGGFVLVGDEERRVTAPAKPCAGRPTSRARGAHPLGRAEPARSWSSWPARTTRACEGILQGEAKRLGPGQGRPGEHAASGRLADRPAAPPERHARASRPSARRSSRAAAANASATSRAPASSWPAARSASQPARPTFAAIVAVARRALVGGAAPLPRAASAASSPRI